MQNRSKTIAQLFSELNLLTNRLHCLESMAIETEHSDQVQVILNTLLSTSLKKIPLNTILEEFINQLTSISWLTPESRGGIFLVNNEAGVLELKTCRTFPSAALKGCSRVPLGKCLCGRVALSGECMFVDRIDERHEKLYPNTTPHGHYCVPITSGENRVIGVIMLYLKEGHCRNATEEAFLTTVAHTLAGTIEFKKVEEALIERSRELVIKNRDAEEANTALKILLKRRDVDKKELKSNIMLNIEALIEPHMAWLKNSSLTSKQRAHLELLESNIFDITSSFANKLSYRFAKLTPIELQVASFVKQGKGTKEISAFLNISHHTVSVHRRNIRKKLGLKNKKINLRTHLLSIPE